jgi:hypothetical protein
MRSINQAYVLQCKEDDSLVVSNIAFNHGRATSKLYGLSSHDSLFFFSRGEMRLRVHQRTLETAFSWAKISERLLDNGLSHDYLVNAQYMAPILSSESNLLNRGVFREELITEALTYLGMACSLPSNLTL